MTLKYTSYIYVVYLKYTEYMVGYPSDSWVCC